jgi:GNAT superfamily N-acetyltransferase
MPIWAHKSRWEIPVTDLIRSALAVTQALMAVGNERFEADGATIIRNREIPQMHDANHVTQVTASTSKQIERLLARVEVEFSGFPHRRFDVDFTTPPAFEAHLTLRDYRRRDDLVLLLENDLLGEARPHEIREVEDDTGWQMYAALHDVDWREFRERIDIPFDERVAEAMMRSRQSKAPPVRYWLAYLEGQPWAYSASWEGLHGVGVVDDLFTHPDFRHRGLATALIHHCVADCRERGAEAVAIVADADDSPKQMYAAMGFRPVAVVRSYRKDIER